MNRFLQGSILCLLLIGFAVDLQAQPRPSDYGGKVYTEIRIDDEGIVLIDSTGNETMVPIGFGEGDLPDAPNIPIPPDAGIDPESYPIKIASIRKIGQSVTVHEDERVLGDVTVIGGNATIKGMVDGTVTAVTGDVRITGTGVVLGDVLANEVIEEQGSQIFGHVQEKLIETPDISSRWRDTRGTEASETFGIGLSIISLLFLFTFAVAMMFRRPTDRIKTLYSQNILKALLVGFLAWILLLPVFILLCITIVGIPLAVLGLPLGMIAAAFLGGAAFALFVGEFVQPKGAVEESRLKKLFIGFIIGQVPTVGFFLGLILDFEAMTIIFGIMAILLNLLVITLGFGGVVLTRFGSRDFRNEKVRVSVEVVTENPTS